MLGTQEGKSIIIENAYSKIEQKIKEIYKLYADNELEKAKRIFAQCENYLKISVNSEFQYLFEGCSKEISNKDIYSMMEDIYQNVRTSDSIKELRNLCEYLAWEINDDMYLVTSKLKIYATQQDALNEIEKYKREGDCESILDRYPDSKKILKVQPDIYDIYLDKNQREMLKVNLLDNLQIKRNIFDNMKDEIINYGLVFLLTVFTAFITVDMSNPKLLSLPLSISFLFTLLIIFIKNKE